MNLTQFCGDQPMIEHIVLVKVKSEHDSEIDNICKSLVELKELIPEIIQINAGRNIASRSQGFQFGLSSIFASENDLQTYLDHPSHRTIVENLISPIKEDIVVLDFERP